MSRGTPRGRISGPLCPVCESRRTRCRATGYGHGDERVRRRVCDDCGHRFLTAEVVVTEVTWGELIPYSRDHDRLRGHRLNGWRERPEMHRDIAYLDVDVQVRRLPRRRAA